MVDGDWEGESTPKQAESKNKVYTYVEQMPELPGGGGNTAIKAALQKNVQYPTEALRNRIEGRVFVSFCVNEQGNVTDVKIEKGLSHGLDEEVSRAVRLLPKFQPGKQSGKAVTVAFTVPVTFTLPVSAAPAP
jgi:protein TonB